MFLFLLSIFYVSNAQIQTCPDSSSLDCALYSATDSAICCMDSDGTVAQYANKCYAECNSPSLDSRPLRMCGECCDPSLDSYCDSASTVYCRGGSTLNTDSTLGFCPTSGDKCAKAIECDKDVTDFCLYKGADYECELDAYDCYTCQLPQPSCDECELNIDCEVNGVAGECITDTWSGCTKCKPLYHHQPPGTTDGCSRDDMCNAMRKTIGDYCWTKDDTRGTCEDDGAECLECVEEPQPSGISATKGCSEMLDACESDVDCTKEVNGVEYAGECIEDPWSGCSRCRHIYQLPGTTDDCPRDDMCNNMWKSIGDHCWITVTDDVATFNIRGECNDDGAGCLECVEVDETTLAPGETKEPEPTNNCDLTDFCNKFGKQVKDPCYLRSSTMTNVDRAKGQCEFEDDEEECLVCTELTTTSVPDATAATDGNDATDATDAPNDDQSTEAPDDGTTSGPDTTDEPGCDAQKYPFARAKRGDCDDKPPMSCTLVIGLSADVCNINGLFTYYSLALQLRLTIREIVYELKTDGVANECDLSKIHPYDFSISPIINNVDEDTADLRGSFVPLTADECPDLDEYCGEDGLKPNYEVSLNLGLRCGSCSELKDIRDALALMVVDGTIDGEFETKCERISAEQDSLCGQGLRDVTLLENPTATLYGEDGSVIEVTEIDISRSDAPHHVYWFAVVVAVFSMFFL